MKKVGNAPIEISSYAPPPLRWILGIFALAIIIVPLHELGRALWPVTIWTLFFGLFLAIPVGMGSLLLAGVIWGPDTRWVITDGNLSIIYQRFAKTLTVIHPRTDFQSSAIEASDSDSGPDTYYLALFLTPDADTRAIPPEFSFLPEWLAHAILMVRNQMIGPKVRLTSPHFQNRPDAEAALSRLMGG